MGIQIQNSRFFIGPSLTPNRSIIQIISPALDIGRGPILNSACSLLEASLNGFLRPSGALLWPQGGSTAGNQIASETESNTWLAARILSYFRERRNQGGILCAIRPAYSIKARFPPWVIELAGEILNGIELDPLSLPDPYVCAWSARSIWLTPPHGRGKHKQVIDRCIREFEAGYFEIGLVLVDNATETGWFPRFFIVC